ncbi:MAG: sulfate permease, partial [Euryarchaeota archaeon]|nr:sulfate permease [Euryarchaeota archaeon]
MMQIGPYRFDRMELAGSLGDLGTLVPLSVAMVAINGLNATAVFLMVGLFYIGAGLYFRLPVPVQPLKVVAALAIASQMDAATIAASGLIFGVSLLLLALTGMIDLLARFFTRPIVRGIQLGLGFILIEKGLMFLTSKDLLLEPGRRLPSAVGSITISPNLLLGIAGIVLVLFLLNNTRFPAAIAVILFGIAASGAMGYLGGAGPFTLGLVPLHLYTPTPEVLLNALFLLVLPQIPLTLGNAVIATSETARNLFSEREAARVTNRALAASMGLVNLATGAVGGMPMCHGAGGLAAHYRFGARTGGSNIIIGGIFVVIALIFGKISVAILGLIPNAVFGVL